MAGGALTPTQRSMLEVLSDGKPHRPSELHRCLPDDMGSLSNIRAHITAIRKVIRARGEEIVCEVYNRSVHYRHVRLLVANVGTGD